MIFLTATPAVAPEPIAVWEMVVSGGIMMIPIALASLIALAVTVERVIVLRRSRVVPSGFVEELKKRLTSGGADSAIKHCAEVDAPIAKICQAGIKAAGRPIDVIERKITEAGHWEVLKLRKHLRVLSVTASVAPLMGLVGTIFGMIRAFQTVALSADALGKTELLAKGIYEAMITTAAGLLVAIPALIFYHWLTAKIERLVSEMDLACLELVEDLAADSASAPVPGATHTNGAAPAPSRVPVTAKPEPA